MDNLRELEKEESKNWLKGVVALICLQKPLEFFVDEQIEIFYREVAEQCGPAGCDKECDLRGWKPQAGQKPPFDCEVCSKWRDLILANHTSPKGKVMWGNCKPHLWSLQKWELAKVYMPDGHKHHNSVGDFDIAAFLCLMNQCKYFKKFELGALCDRASCVRNKIMHASKYQLVTEDLHDYLARIKELGEMLARHDAKFRSLSDDINEIQNLDYKLVLPNDLAAQQVQAQNEKELEDILFAVAEEAARHHQTRMKLERLERQIEELQQDNEADYYALTHIPRGLCVVINNEEFRGQCLRNRRGTQLDAEALRTVFSRLGFAVVIHNNLTAEEIRCELQRLGSRNFEEEDALVVCMLSHGELGYVYGTDEQLLPLQALTRPFTSGNAPSLAGKPKLFFIQACQGSDFQGGSLLPPRQREGDSVVWLEEDAGPSGVLPVSPRPSEEEEEEEEEKEEEGGPSRVVKDALHEDARGKDAGPEVACRPACELEKQGRLEADASSTTAETVPWYADFLLGMATMPQYKSFRNTTKGSIYIQELCAQLMKSAESLRKDDILTVLTHVNREISKQTFLQHKQIPEPKYTLTKKLVLKCVTDDQQASAILKMV